MKSLRALATSGAALLLACVISCDKVPLHENRGNFDLVNAHWFANEKTEYVFFSISGLRPAQARVAAAGTFQISTGSAIVAGLQPGPDGFANLDMNKAVHHHHLVECGAGRLCGSYSFHTEQPVSAVSVRYLYAAGSPMGEATSMSTTIHADGPTADSQSALVYGVFNGDNTRVQIRVHDNFGSPNSGEIQNYGLERSFAIENLQLAPLTMQDEQMAAQISGSQYLFPTSACSTHLNSTGESFKFSGREVWAARTLDGNDPSSDACFSVRSLDHSGGTLKLQPAMARRNPELGVENLTLHPPISDAHLVPLVLSYCQNRPESAQLTNADFLRYQYYIFGIPGDHPVDACFATGEEDRFTQDLKRAIDQRLSEARSAGSDLFLTVVVNHILAPLVQKRYHDIIAKVLSDKIGAELLLVSPRLVGAFVYDSRAVDTPAGQGPVIWCPRDEKNAGPEGSVEANCTPINLDKLDLGVVNFKIPMGPFPTVDKFITRLQNGDRGEMHNPHFSARAVRTNPSSMTAGVNSVTYTFFDNERISLGEGEKIKFCHERDTDDMLNEMVFPAVTAQGGPMGVDDAQTYLNSSSQAKSLHMGLLWSQPFIGAFSYDAPIAGHILSVIPIQKTFNVKDSAGDPRWSIPSWNVGPLMQKCLRHCDHPFFDESAVYQIASPWSAASRCVQPSIKEPNQ
jgi:hypothetical protein